MTTEQLNATFAVCQRKKQALLSKAEPGKPVPRWITEEIKFVESLENLAQMHFRKCHEYEKMYKMYLRTVELFQVLERAFFGFIPFRHCFQWYNETIGVKSIHTLTLLNLLSLLPDTDKQNRESLIQMINEHTSRTIEPAGIRERLSAAN